jgi:hypothetical protein
LGALQAGIPGKMAILAQFNGQWLYSSTRRLFNSFIVWADNHQLPREFKMFQVMASACQWLGLSIDAAQLERHL